MRNFTLLLLALFFIAGQQNILAQSGGVCTPDMNFVDFGIFPGPDTSDVLFSDPTLGISTIGCSGQDFAFTFTAVIPDSLDAEPFIGVPAILPIVEIDVTGVTGFDAIGWTVANNLLCSETDCIFTPSPPEPGGLTYGCALVTGTLPTVAVQTDYSIAFTLDATVILFGSETAVPLTYPSEPAFPGQYIIRVDPPGGPGCATGVEDIISQELSVAQNIPNPFSSNTQITLSATKNTSYDFKVFNLVGKEVHTEKVSVVPGDNTIQFDGSTLNPGIYLYSFGNDDGVITKRMVIDR